MPFTINKKQVAPVANKKKVELATGGQIRYVLKLIQDGVIKLPFNEAFKGINGKDYTLEINDSLESIIFAPKFLLSLLLEKYGKKDA